MSNIAIAGTTTADFLKWERKSQESFLRISISMAGSIATQVRPETARCIDDWYFKSVELQRQRHSEIIDVMPSYREYSPTVVVLGVLESACGKFKQP